ncbi:MAG: sodium:solute symporter family transporter [Planctomycetota bacterium]
MPYLPNLDIIIVVAYLVCIVAIGLYMSRRAATGIESYFLSGRKMPAWLLAISGGFSWFDVAGTMWIIGMFYSYGFKAIWPQWMWGLVMPAFWMAYIGKWIRRSGVMTGAEWMKTRFGTGADGRAAHTTMTLVAVITTVAFLSTASVGIGKFWSEFLGWSPHLCSTVILGCTALYVIFGGMYSVVYTDIIQGVMLTVASVIVGVFAFSSLAGQSIESMAPAGWTSLAPVWRLPDAPNATYKLFGLMTIMWVFRGFLVGSSGPVILYEFQRFLAARNPRDASKIAMLWAVFFSVWWVFVIGIAVLVISRPDITVTDPERCLPAVLHAALPIGVRGILMAALMGAFMSTFDSTVNSGAAYIVRDVYQQFIVPGAGRRHLVIAGYLASAALVAVGIFIGFVFSSIEQIIHWIFMAFGSGILMPLVLRWYWWRFNGWGSTIGMVTGVLASLAQAVFYPETPLYLSVPVIMSLSLCCAVIATLLTRPTASATLDKFYRNVRPWGFWAPVKRRLTPAQAQETPDSPASDIAATLVGMPWIIALYMVPIYLITHCWTQFFISSGIVIFSSILLYFLWYKKLPPPDELEEPPKTEI